MLRHDTRELLSQGVESKPLVSLVVPYYNLPDCLPDTLVSLAAQDYPRLEVFVVNDGSTDPHALEVWEQMQAAFPQFQFISQENCGLGAARNTGLALAQGEYFLPVDADNIGRIDMVSQFVRAHESCPHLAAATCFFLAFEETADIEQGKFCYAYRPCGGPYVAAALRNVYGDANAMFRTADLRAVGGFETEKDTTCEDWEAFVKLARQGYQIDVVPEYLFYYRYRPTSMLRTTDAIMNRRRVLRQFFSPAELPEAEQIELWTALAGFDERQQRFQTEMNAKQQEIWTAQANQVAKEGELAHARARFDEERQRMDEERQRMQVQLAKANRFGSDIRRLVRGGKGILRKAPYYAVVSGKLKQFKARDVDLNTSTTEAKG
jgi:GT2 family glycosyltransferase